MHTNAFPLLSRGASIALALTVLSCLAPLALADGDSFEWTFVKGTPDLKLGPVHGTQGVAAPDNWPGPRGRYSFVSPYASTLLCRNSAGDVYLYGDRAWTPTACSI